VNSWPSPADLADTAVLERQETFDPVKACHRTHVEEPDGDIFTTGAGH
jgi:hypothetical protein